MHIEFVNLISNVFLFFVFFIFFFLLHAYMVEMIGAIDDTVSTGKVNTAQVRCTLASILMTAKCVRQFYSTIHG